MPGCEDPGAGAGVQDAGGFVAWRAGGGFEGGGFTGEVALETAPGAEDELADAGVETVCAG